MTNQDFWAKKRQELQQQGKLPIPHQSVTSHNGAWWQDTVTGPIRHDNANPDPQTFSPDTSHHDFSKADHLRSAQGNCPNCNSTAFMKPSSSGAARCFDCGYIQGRDVNDLSTFTITADVNTIKVKQTPDGGADKYRTRMSTNASDLRMAGAELEQSYAGKSRVDS